MLSREEFATLAAARGGVRVSLYLPTHRGGPRTKEGAIHLKNLLASAEDLALAAGVRGADFRERLAPARERIDDTGFWNHQADGLALFVDGEGLRDHRLPARMEELAYVGDRFCVRPLLPVVSAGARFHVLALSQNQVRLVECTRSSSREVDLRDIPRNLKDAVGYDYEERSLQFHSGTSPFTAGLRGGGGRRAAMFHGHGQAADEDKDELERFLRLVADGVRSIVADGDAPLVLATVGSVAAIYRRVGKRSRLVDEIIEGNPETESAEALQRAALPLVMPFLDADRRDAVAAVAESAGSDRLVTGIGDALALLEQGRVATLLVRDSAPLWGRLAGGGAQTHDARQPGDDDLLDLAVHRGLETGAVVHAAAASDLPEGAPLAALVRY